MKSLVLFPLSAILFFACNDAATHEGKIETPNDVAEVTTSSVSEESNPSPVAETIAAPVSKPRKFRQKSLNKVSLPLPSDELILPQKQSQAFVFRPDKDTLITCAEGTILRINAKCFIDAQTCEPVLTPIKMEVKEFYKTSDILLAKLSTWANGEILETSGMLHLSASSNDRECVIDDGKFIEITFPTEEKKEGMQLFTGTWTPDNQMNWQMVSGSRDRNEIVKVPDTLASFHYGYDQFTQYLSARLQPNYGTARYGQNYRNVISFIVDTVGTIVGPVADKGMNDPFTKDVISALNEYGSMKPARLNGVSVNTRFYLPVSYGVYNNRCFENNYYMNVTGYQSVRDTSYVPPTPQRFINYTFQGGSLGWINCDRFLNIPKEEKTDIFVKQPVNKDTRVNLVMHNYSSILSSYWGSDGYRFTGVPKGEPVTLIVFKSIDGVAHMAVKHTTTDERDHNDLEFREIPMDAVSDGIERALVVI